MVALRVLHVTDLHLGADPGRLHGGLRPDEALCAVLDRVTGPLDLIVATGDLSEDASDESYRRVAEHLAPLAPRVHWVPGNHDDPERMARVLESRGLSGAPHLHVGHWHFVFLDSRRAGENYGSIAHRLTPLLDVLNNHIGEPIAVAIHHPPIAPCLHPDCNLTDAGALLEVTDRCSDVRVVLSGHVHLPFDVHRGGTRFLGGPSTCIQYDHWTDGHAIADRPPGALLLELGPAGEIDVAMVRATAVH